MRMLCQICGEYIGLVGFEAFEEISGETGLKRIVKALRYPITGDMFGCPDAFHNFDRPFDPTLEWEPMRCPYGRTHRPMVQDDAVLTHKGIVRLPKDGSPAYLDKGASIEVDRHSVGDRVMQVPDDVAEKIAREALGAMAVDPGAESVTIINEKSATTYFKKPITGIVLESKEPIPPLHIYEVTVDPEKSAWICATCGKRFDKQKSLQGHMMSHKKAAPKAKKKGKK